MSDFQRERTILSKEEERGKPSWHPWTQSPHIKTPVGMAIWEAKRNGDSVAPAPFPPAYPGLGTITWPSWVLCLLSHPLGPCCIETRRLGSASFFSREQTPDSRCVPVTPSGRGGKTHCCGWIKAWETLAPPWKQTTGWLSNRDRTLGWDRSRDNVKKSSISLSRHIPTMAFYLWALGGKGLLIALSGNSQNIFIMLFLWMKQE